MHTKPGKTSYVILFEFSFIVGIVFFEKTFEFSSSPRTSNKTVAVHRTSYEDGNLSCEFSFDTSSVTIDGEPQSIFINTDYYLLYASGKMKNESKNEDDNIHISFFDFSCCFLIAKIGKHDTILVSPITYQLQNTENLDLDNLPV